MTILIVSNSAWNLKNFRGELIRHWSSAGHEVYALCRPDRCSLEELSSLGCRAFALEHMDARGRNPFRDIRLYAELVDRMSGIRPGMIMLYTPKINIYGGLAATMLGIPHIVNVAGLGSTFTRRMRLSWMMKMLYRLGLRRAFKVAFHNRHDLDYFTENGIIAQNRAIVIPGSGVNADHFVSEAKVKRVRNFLFAGRLLPEKGIVEFLEAAMLLATKYPDARWKVVGGDAGEGLEELFGRAASCPQIIMQGFTDDVRSVFNWADVFVLLSRREGLSRALLEAMSMERVVIVSDVPGCRDAVMDGMNGMLVRETGISALAAAMEKAVSMDAAQIAKMTSGARERVLIEFSSEMIIAMYDSLLEMIAQKRNARG